MKRKSEKARKDKGKDRGGRDRKRKGGPGMLGTRSKRKEIKKPRVPSEGSGGRQMCNVMCNVLVKLRRNWRDGFCVLV